jgi:hypothetical protein
VKPLSTSHWTNDNSVVYSVEEPDEDDMASTIDLISPPSRPGQTIGQILPSSATKFASPRNGSSFEHVSDSKFADFAIRNCHR